MSWVLGPRVTVDAACSGWLIRRFIDPAAELVFAVAPVSGEGSASVRFEQSGADKQSRFAALLRAYELTDPVLWRLAESVRLAAEDLDEYHDTDALRLDVACRGLRLLHEDRSVVELIGIVMDELYDARSRTAATESHADGEPELASAVQQSELTGGPDGGC